MFIVKWYLSCWREFNFLKFESKIYNNKNHKRKWNREADWYEWFLQGECAYWTWKKNTTKNFYTSNKALLDLINRKQYHQIICVQKQSVWKFSPRRVSPICIPEETCGNMLKKYLSGEHMVWYFLVLVSGKYQQNHHWYCKYNFIFPTY